MARRPASETSGDGKSACWHCNFEMFYEFRYKNTEKEREREIDYAPPKVYSHENILELNHEIFRYTIFE